MKKTSLFAALAGLSLLASNAMAYDPFPKTDEEGGGKIYGGISVGKTNMKGTIEIPQYDSEGNMTEILMLECSSNDCDGSNWKAFAGYEITSNLAVEAAYHSILKANGPDPLNLTATGLSASGVYNFPVSEEAKVFGKAGAISWNLSDEHEYYSYFKDKSGTDFLLGAGAAYNLNDNWGIRGEYEHIGGYLDADMYSVGAVFSSM